VTEVTRKDPPGQALQATIRQLRELGSALDAICDHLDRSQAIAADLEATTAPTYHLRTEPNKMFAAARAVLFVAIGVYQTIPRRSTSGTDGVHPACLAGLEHLIARVETHLNSAHLEVLIGSSANHRTACIIIRNHAIPKCLEMIEQLAGL
jgi:hypothetical protein